MNVCVFLVHRHLAISLALSEIQKLRVVHSEHIYYRTIKISYV